MIEPTQVQVPAAKGLNTYAARGSTDAPRVLKNALLRPGGWACAPAAQQRLEGVSYALYTGRGREVFVSRPDGVGVYTVAGEKYLGGQQLGTSLRDGVTLAPGLAFVDTSTDWLYLHADFGVRSMLHAATFQRSYNADNPPAGPWYRLTDSTSGRFEADKTYRVRVVPILGPSAPASSPYRWGSELTITPSTRGELTLGRLSWPVNVYVDGVFVTTNVQYGQVLPVLSGIGPTPNVYEVPTEAYVVKPFVAEYHQGRVWVTGETKLYDPKAADPVRYEGRRGTRLYFSEVTIQITQDSLPTFTTDNYLDVPFKVSVEITALLSVGRYLYIFGDAEVFVLTGHDDQTWNLESVGEGIGAVDAASVQRFQSAALYLSDAGVLLLSGGQVQDVSGDVRDRVTALNRRTLSSAVDFERGLYLLSDGATTLVYHLKEQGWTERVPDAPGQRLVGGSGVVYSVHGGALHTLDSPDLLPLTVTLGPFGRPGQRRTWRGVTGAVDSDAGGTARVVLSGLDTDMAFLPVSVPGAPQNRPAHAGLTPVAASVGSADGVALSAALVELTVTLTPAPGARRCILRPPLEIVGNAATEAWA